ncbi:restriction endonuclease [Streptococcus thermophilus]|uniref:restriction endonuclease n=1 Tax=Streptococcus thermophilus TaxID=1308 RepID=UPI001A984E1B|nr:restriction endonuclease [Streptococcus thermophilus]MBO1147821.1 restriction endonuclease [Streptococcus thermophilus]MBO1159090.1 restriction endonuclease [Streptococcus thermophilus]MBO1160736.1 restriction endonuclease [Streptococcus thermophilus]QTA43016.1 restriction endonuclease [Streptococcus thermophilus]QTA44668.1 restriction endonuclease [Streptococcus thermophilus]
MEILTVDKLIEVAIDFSNKISSENHVELLGVTDGKAVGTYVEHRFKEYLLEHFTFIQGNSAKGIDLPSVNTDIKVTSIKQPQSSCPFKSARQKIFGLGYNLLVFVYDKVDIGLECHLNIINTTFIDEKRTADYTLTRQIHDILSIGGIKEDIIALLEDRSVPGDELVYNDLAEEIMENPPIQGYLTISNALQWRLQYRRVISLDNKIDGVINFGW